MHQKRKSGLGKIINHILENPCQALMKRCKLKNKANKTKLLIEIRNYKKKKNYVVNLIKSEKSEYFSPLAPTRYPAWHKNIQQAFWNP